MVFAVGAAAFGQTRFGTCLKQGREDRHRQEHDERSRESPAMANDDHGIFSTRMAPLYSQAARTDPSGSVTNDG